MNKTMAEIKFGYTWVEANPESYDGTYTYYESVDCAKDAFAELSDDVNKTYGIAQFIDGILEPVSVIGTTI